MTYAIEVKREGEGNRVCLEVNGAKVAGDVVPLPAAGTREVAVKATLH